jgi:hypothetical protein
MSTLEKIEIKNIDHLGIVAGIIDSIGLVEIVNELLGEDPSEKISAGHVVKDFALQPILSKPNDFSLASLIPYPHSNRMLEYVVLAQVYLKMLANLMH